MIARTVPDNADWEDVKHKSVLFDPHGEDRRTIKGADNWYEQQVSLCPLLGLVIVPVVLILQFMRLG